VWQLVEYIELSISSLRSHFQEPKWVNRLKEHRRIGHISCIRIRKNCSELKTTSKGWDFGCGWILGWTAPKRPSGSSWFWNWGYPRSGSTTLKSEMESSRPWLWTWSTSRTICHVLVHGLERRVLRGQVLGLRGKALGPDPFSLVSLVYVDRFSIMNVGWYGYIDKTRPWCCLVLGLLGPVWTWN